MISIGQSAVCQILSRRQRRNTLTTPWQRIFVYLLQQARTYEKEDIMQKPSDTVTYRTVIFLLYVKRVQYIAKLYLQKESVIRYVQLPSGFKSHRFSSSSIAAQQESNRVHVVNNGSPSRIRMVRRISLGMTTLPRSSILLTIPVAFILYLSPYILVALLLFVRICGLY